MQSVELSVKSVRSLMGLENKKFLIVNLRFHGDVLLTKPMIDDLKTNYPNALIDLLVFKGTASLLKDDEFKKATIGMIPLGRLGEIKDVMGPFVFLASDASSLMTGSSLLVDGGWTSR